MWIGSEKSQTASTLEEGVECVPDTSPQPQSIPAAEQLVSAPVEPALESPALSEPKPAQPLWRHGWPVPSTICANPEEARACIQLPEFDPDLIEMARAISDFFPAAEAQYRALRRKANIAAGSDIPRFERVFRIAETLAGVKGPSDLNAMDELLILTAWNCVRPKETGFLGSYPKALLCPLSHAEPPVALDSLSAAQRIIFDRRAPFYLRYLLCEKLGLRTCADVEQADLRQLLRCTGFRLIRSSAVPEVAFSGISRGDDPAVRPWKLTLRQELSDDRAADMLIHAALWWIKYGGRLVDLEPELPRWNIGAFERTDWEDAFLSLGVRISPRFMRDSGLLNWRAVLARCVEEIGSGNLPPEVLGRVVAVPQRVSHDDDQSIWSVLDHAGRLVLKQVCATEPGFFLSNGELNYEQARAFRRWVRLFDEVSPQILSRFGVSAFTVLHRVAPQYFGWGRTHLKPWELEQERGKWKGPLGRARLRSAYAFALYEAGLGTIDDQDNEPLWQCSQAEFSAWSLQLAQEGRHHYDFLYELASRHGLTPLLNREVKHTEAVSLMAGTNVHANLPRIEGCWEVCMRAALEQHAGRLEVRLALPDLVPLPLRLRKAVLKPLDYAYLHKELRLVRDFDLQLARESHRRLEEVPGWWDDERILGTPLAARLADPTDTGRIALAALHPDPWLETPAQRVRFRALKLLLHRGARRDDSRGTVPLSSADMRALLRLALEATLEHSNTAHVSFPSIRRGFERVLAREDTREMLDSLLLHVGTAYETEVWGKVRKFIVLDVINDLLALTIRCSLLHLMSAD